MSDPREILEQIARSAPAPTPGLEGLRRRRRRREVRRRAAAFVVAAIIVVPGAWLIINALGGLRDGKQPAYQPLASSNVANIAHIWQADIGGVSTASAATDRTMVYVGTASGTLLAIDPIDGSQAWSTQLDGIVTSKPVVAAGRVYVHTNQGMLYAFPSSCQTPCPPIWTARTGSTASSTPTAGGGYVFVVSDKGGLFAFSADCGSGGSACLPAWVAHTGQHLPVEVAVSGGVVWDSSSEALLAFGESCGTASAECRSLTDGFRPAAPLSGPPVVAGDVVYVGGGDGSLYAIPTACASDRASCRPLWIGKTHGPISSTPLVEGRVVYVGSNDGNVYAYPALCRADGSTCKPSWIGRTVGPISDTPAFAGGVVFVPSGDEVYMFAGSGPSTGRRAPIARRAFGSRTLQTIVSNERVLIVEARSGILFALAVGRAGP